MECPFSYWSYPYSVDIQENPTSFYQYSAVEALRLSAINKDCQKIMVPINRDAFSLVELLVVIAVIAVIAAIALPNIANVVQAADSAKIRRNAQTVAATYNAAIAAGLPTNAAVDLPSALTLIRGGTNLEVGATFQYYAVDGLSDTESSNAQGLLLFTNGTIRLLSSSN